MSRFIMPRQGVNGQNMSPGDGAKLYFYTQSTTTLKDTYTTSALSTANSNPMIADATGLFGSIYLNGDYDCKLTDKNGVQLWSAEGIDSYPTLNGNNTWTGTNDYTTGPTVNSGDIYHEANINEAVVPINAQTGTTYTFILSDRGSLVTMDNASANVITLPLNSAVPYPIGTVLTVRQKGAGETTIAAAVGVTITSAISKGLVIGERGEWGSMIQEAIDTWSIAGVTKA